MAAENSSAGRTASKVRANVGWLDEQVSPNHFCKVIVAPELGVLHVPEAFRPYLGEIPAEVTVRTNTGYVWSMTLVDLNGKTCLDRGWAGFTIAYDLKIGFLLLFKKLGAKEYKVTIFNKSGCEFVKKCADHPQNLKKKKIVQ